MNIQGRCAGCFSLCDVAGLYFYEMNMNQITTRKMLQEMQNGEPFTITVTTFDKRRKEKSGKVINYEGILCKKEEKPDIEGRPLTQHEAKKDELERLRRNPNHYDNYTRNLQVCVNGFPTSERRKFHPPLVSRFNGMVVP